MLLTGSYMLRTLLGTLQASSPLIFMPLLQKPLLSSCKETVLTELHSPKWVAFTLIIADPPFRVHFFREWMSFWGKAAEGVGTFAEVSKLYLLLLPRGRVGPEVWPRNWGFNASFPWVFSWSSSMVSYWLCCPLQLHSIQAPSLLFPTLPSSFPCSFQHFLKQHFFRWPSLEAPATFLA